MGLDIRLPIGLMFTVIGMLLTGYGAMADPAIFSKSLGINVDLLWGGALLAFGIIFVVAGRRGTTTLEP